MGATLQAKLERLDAYRRYAEEGDRALWSNLVESELASIELLCDEIDRLVREGKFTVPAARRGES